MDLEQELRKTKTAGTTNNELHVFSKFHAIIEDPTILQQQEELLQKDVIIKDLRSSIQANNKVITDLEQELKLKKTKIAGTQ